MSNTTDRGITITVEERKGERIVVMYAPDAPEGAQEIEAGRITNVNGGRNGFQPPIFMPGLLSPSALRIIADLVDQEPANE